MTVSFIDGRNRRIRR